MADLMLTYGPNLGMPHTRVMSQGLLELRIKAGEGIARVFYCTQTGHKIIMLHCFLKKMQKTPKHHLAIAQQRQKQVQIEYANSQRNEDQDAGDTCC
jgi:phage-related protein